MWAEKLGLLNPLLDELGPHLTQRRLGRDLPPYQVAYLNLSSRFVRPHLEYAIQAWSPYLRKDIDCVERVQRSATKMVKGFLQYELRLNRLKLTSLEKRRQRGDLIETYKILTGKEGVDPHCFFTQDKNRYGTRGHELKLYTRRSRLELRRNFFSQRVVPHWNKLPESVVMAESVDVFKNRLDRCEKWGI